MSIGDDWMETTKRTDLLLAAYSHPSQETKDSSGIRVVEMINDDGKLFELSTDKKFPEKARVAAGLKWAGTLVRRGEYHNLANHRNNTNLPAAVREVLTARFEEALLVSAKEAHPSHLFELITRYGSCISKETREKIEEGIVRTYVDSGNYASLRAISKDPDTEKNSKHLRRLARENIDAAAENFVDQNYGSDTLVELARARVVKSEIRIKAAEKAIKFCCGKPGEKPNLETLEEIATSWFTIPFKQVRAKAGKEYVKLCIEQGEYNALHGLAKWGIFALVPKEVRIAAKEGVKQAVSNCMEEATKNGDYHSLLALKKDIQKVAPDLAPKLEEALARSAERKIELDEHNCQSVARNAKLPPEAREKAGRMYLKQVLDQKPKIGEERIDTIKPGIIQIMEDQRFVEPVREAAGAELIKICRDCPGLIRGGLLGLAQNEHAPEKTRVAAGEVFLGLDNTRNSQYFLSLLEKCDTFPPALAEKIRELARAHAEKQVAKLPGEGEVLRARLEQPKPCSPKPGNRAMEKRPAGG